jgi:hypothetical protein
MGLPEQQVECENSQVAVGAATAWNGNSGAAAELLEDEEAWVEVLGTVEVFE